MITNIPLLSQTTQVLTPYQMPQELTKGQEKAAKSWGVLTHPLNDHAANRPDSRKDIEIWAAR